MDMNRLSITLLVTVMSSISYLSFNFIRNYNSQDNIEKRCIIKFQKEVKNNVGTSDKEWYLNMDTADNNYLKCIGMP